MAIKGDHTVHVVLSHDNHARAIDETQGPPPSRCPELERLLMLLRPDPEHVKQGPGFLQQRLGVAHTVPSLDEGRAFPQDVVGRRQHGGRLLQLFEAGAGLEMVTVFRNREGIEGAAIN